MRYQRIAKMAKQAIDKRGGVDALKQDLQGAADAAKGQGSLKEKAKAAAESLKQSGSATAHEPSVASDVPVPPPPPVPAQAQAQAQAPESPIVEPAAPPADAGVAASEPGAE
jgi:hypothetical protein